MGGDDTKSGWREVPPPTQGRTLEEEVGVLVIGVKLGSQGGEPKGDLGIPAEALTRHVCILGTTGSGKSTTALLIVQEAKLEGIPVLVLDRTGEHAKALGKLSVPSYRPGRELVTALFQRDLARPLPEQVEDWVDLLNHFTSVTFHSSLSPLQLRVLRENLTQYYSGTSEVLTVTRLIAKLRAYEDRTRERNGWEESIEAVISRLLPLTVGDIGKAVDMPYSTLRIEDLLKPEGAVIDLSGLGTDAAKNLFSQVVLKRLYDRVRDAGESDNPRAMAVVDEAQHLAPNDPHYLSVPERAALELRKYGLGLVMIAARPSLLSPNVISSCGTIISHMLNNERDVETVKGYMLSADPALGDRIRSLPVGYAVVQINHPSPQRAELCRMGTSSQRAALELPPSYWDPSLGRYMSLRKRPSRDASSRE